MPSVHVFSSVARSSINGPAAKRIIAEGTAKALACPLAKIIAQINLDQDMFASESDEPCAFVHVRSIGRITPELNPTTVAVLSESVSHALNLPLSRISIHLEDVAASNWGMNGKTMG